MKRRYLVPALTLVLLSLVPNRAAGERTGLRPSPLPPPPERLLRPLDREVILKPIAERAFSWTPVEEAVLYRLEISTDPEFRILLLETYPTSNSFTVRDLPEGTFYWHVSSINAAGLEGRFSTSFSFFYPRRAR